MAMSIQDACKKMIQSYYDGTDVQPDGRKYTKDYLDNFHKEKTGTKAVVNGKKQVAAELLNASSPSPVSAANVAPTGPTQG